MRSLYQALIDFISELILRKSHFDELVSAICIPAPIDHSTNKITQNYLWNKVPEYIKPNSIVVAETGTSEFGAAVGAAIADRSRQLFLFVGNGSFQLTFQEISEFLHHGLTPVIFLLNNDGYLIAKLIHGPERDYNNYQMWQYSKTLDFFGAHRERNTSTGCSKVGFESKISTRQEFEAAMDSITAQPDKMHFVEVVMPRFDAPRELELLVATSENC
ncbi:hypothetical protein [Parasitella parasitica]|uniref:Thiamine pyrophosphate enzyme TPP-binding domain-containing protein n=1 Tax=Parasitella parasitica TaxID=35722 RepID=A0A0B7NR21_9FUNG|nr:hypothetical protein [Parasitella parasitica]